jgi:nucleoside-diphosphate-sugar epimerase
MNIILTGATGYVGNNLLSVLLKQKKYKLFAISRNSCTLPDEVTVILDNYDMEENIISAKPDIVIHLASYLTSKANLEDIDKLITSNITFGTRILNALNKIQIKSFINVGSFAEYHYNDGVLNPTYLYSATKTAFRSILKYYSEVHKFKVVHVIPYTIYGGIDRQKKILDILFEALDANEPVKMSQGYQYLDFIHLKDVVDFFLILIKELPKINNNEELHLGTGKAYSLREVATMIESFTGKKINADWGAYPSRDRDTYFACAAIGKLKHSLNWQPKITIEVGLRLKYNEIAI